MAYLFELQIEMMNEFHWQFVLAEIRNPGFQDQLS